MNYVPDEEMILKWFNKQYDENAETIKLLFVGIN
jgi:intergrase/recombinase